MAVLVVLLDLEGTEGRVFEISDGEHYVGRLSAASICLPDSSSVSRLHARLYQEGGLWWIEDLRSRNGISVNGQKVETSKLLEGDLLGVGEVFMMFSMRNTESLGYLSDELAALRSRADATRLRLIEEERQAQKQAARVPESKKITAGFNNRLMHQATSNLTPRPVVSHIQVNRAPVAKPVPRVTGRVSASSPRYAPPPQVTGPDVPMIVGVCIVVVVFVAALVWKFAASD